VTANIDPINRAAPGGAAPAGQPSGAGSGQFAAALQKAQQSQGVADAVIPPSPPAELAGHIAAAARAWEALSAAGQHVSFTETPDGRVSINLHDEEGSGEPLSGSSLFDLIEREGAE
jgi:hypothetical protein